MLNEFDPYDELSLFEKIDSEKRKMRKQERAVSLLREGMSVRKVAFELQMTDEAVRLIYETLVLAKPKPAKTNPADDSPTDSSPRKAKPIEKKKSDAEPMRDSKKEAIQMEAATVLKNCGTDFEGKVAYYIVRDGKVVIAGHTHDEFDPKDMISELIELQKYIEKTKTL